MQTSQATGLAALQVAQETGSVRPLAIQAVQATGLLRMQRLQMRSAVWAAARMLQCAASSSSSSPGRKIGRGAPCIVLRAVPPDGQMPRGTEGQPLIAVGDAPPAMCVMSLRVEKVKPSSHLFYEALYGSATN